MNLRGHEKWLQPPTPKRITSIIDPLQALEQFDDYEVSKSDGLYHCWIYLKNDFVHAQSTARDSAIEEALRLCGLEIA